MTDKTQHELHTMRRNLGRRMVTGGTVYGTVGRCSGCDWRVQVNQAPSKGGERAVRRLHEEAHRD